MNSLTSYANVICIRDCVRIFHSDHADSNFDAGALHNFGSPGDSLRPFSASRSRVRPQTAGMRMGGNTIQVASYEDHRSLVFMKSEGELHGFTSPHTSRPSSSYRVSRATTVLHSAASTPAETPRPIKMSSAGPSRPDSASSSRNVQLSEIDRIKRAFARSKIVCPLNVIERALAIPEDRFVSLSFSPSTLLCLKSTELSTHFVRSKNVLNVC